MFDGCYSLESLDLSSFNTRRVENMSSMFKGCQLIKQLDISNFNTTKVKDMTGMFLNCISLEELDISWFKANKKLTRSDFMFVGCSKLKTIKFPSNKRACKHIEDAYERSDKAIVIK